MSDISNIDQIVQEILAEMPLKEKGAALLRRPTKQFEVVHLTP